ncbi:rod shape-determining protein [bacterium]|nr:MAG: rod shape-determining protein [bacterium]
MFDTILAKLTYDVAIDLGTSTTLVGVKGFGNILLEPTVVAVNKKTSQILAVGSEAKEMVGRTPGDIVAVRPMRDGVIKDYEMTQAMLKYFLHKAQTIARRMNGTWKARLKIDKPRVIIGVPSGITDVERKAVIDSAKFAGARTVFIIEEAMAAAIGAELPIDEASGSMIIDIGGGTTDIAILSLGAIVSDETIRIAGDFLDAELQNFIKEKFGVQLGDQTIENMKIEIASLDRSKLSISVKGRGIKDGLPKAQEVTSSDIESTVASVLAHIINAAKQAIESAPPEILGDILENGITLAGGGAQIRGLSEYLTKELHVPVKITEDPVSCVLRGCMKVIDNFSLLSRLQVDE